MKVCHTLTCVLLAYVGHVAAFITAGVDQAAVTPCAAAITASDLIRIQVPTPSTLITSTVAIQGQLSAASITTAPTSDAYVVRRQTQKCFNDQGFQVDCATWTGYYYSWGPPGNPYEGGPGDGQWDGSGSGSDSGSGTLVYQSTATSFDQLSFTMIATACLLVIALFL